MSELQKLWSWERNGEERRFCRWQDEWCYSFAGYSCMYRTHFLMILQYSRLQKTSNSYRPDFKMTSIAVDMTTRLQQQLLIWLQQDFNSSYWYDFNKTSTVNDMTSKWPPAVDMTSTRLQQQLSISIWLQQDFKSKYRNDFNKTSTAAIVNSTKLKLQLSWLQQNLNCSYRNYFNRT